MEQGQRKVEWLAPALFMAFLLGGPLAGFAAATLADPRHDVEWVGSSVVLTGLGLVVGLVLGVLAVRLVARHDRARR